MSTISRVVLIVATIAACAVGGAAVVQGSESLTRNRAADIDEALLNYELNNDTAESAPQQQVVNGWATKDLLEISTRQLDDLAEMQQRTNVLLGLAVAVMALSTVAIALRNSRPYPTALPPPPPAAPHA